MRNNRFLVFILSSCLLLISMLYRASNAVVAPELSRDLGLGPEALGLMGAVFFYVFALAQIPLGLVLDRIGAKRTIIVLNLVGMAGAVAFASAQGLPGGLTGRALLGLGMSANLMGPLKLFTRWFKAGEFATVSGLTVSLGALGSVLATSPLLLLAQALGWRGAFLFLAGLNLLLILGLVLWTSDGPESGDLHSAEKRSSGPSVITAAWTLFRSPNYWAIATAAGLRYGVFAAFQTLWAGPYLMIHLGLPDLTAGNLLLLLTVGFVLGGPVGGLLAERVL
ncbi:MAG: MFS transporter, partial [Thermodesulfobacteriota bacterium]